MNFTPNKATNHIVFVLFRLETQMLFELRVTWGLVESTVTLKRGLKSNPALVGGDDVYLHVFRVFFAKIHGISRVFKG
jgi:hypothetical protein